MYSLTQIGIITQILNPLAELLYLSACFTSMFVMLTMLIGYTPCYIRMKDSDYVKRWSQFVCFPFLIFLKKMDYCNILSVTTRNVFTSENPVRTLCAQQKELYSWKVILMITNNSPHINVLSCRYFEKFKFINLLWVEWSILSQFSESAWIIFRF